MVSAVKVVPIISMCAADHITWPTICGCRVIRVTPDSHMCSFGRSTAATSRRLNVLGYRKKKERYARVHAAACAVGSAWRLHSTIPSYRCAMK